MVIRFVKYILLIVKRIQPLLIALLVILDILGVQQVTNALVTAKAK